MKRAIKAAAGLLFSVGMVARSAYAVPDITTQTIPFNFYAQDAYATLSADGRYVAFKIEQRGSGSYPKKIYVQDLVTGERIQANIRLDGKPDTGASCDIPAMSANGRYVVFGCRAADMGGTTLGGGAYFVYDKQTNSTQMIPDLGDDRAAPGHGAGISADGRYIAFRTQTPSGVYKIYVRDMVNKTTSALNAAQSVTAPPGGTRLSISADGRYIAYVGKATLTSTTVNASVYDRQTGVTEAVDVHPDGSRTTANVSQLTMSDDGSIVAFSIVDPAMAATAPVTGMTGAYVRDRKAGKTELASASTLAQHAISTGTSGNGRYVAYMQGTSTYVYDRQTKLSRKIVVPNLFAYGPPRLSTNGRYVAFTTVNSAGNMQSLTVADMGVEAGVNLSATTLTLTEGGNAGTYSMVLTRAPDADVKIALGTNAQLSLARSELTFTADNWSTPQLVSAQAVADGITEGQHSATITHAVTSGDPYYAVVKPASVTANISDGITPTIVIPGAIWHQSDLPLTGTAAPGATILLTAVNRTTGWTAAVSTVADAQGNWGYTLTGFTDGVVDLDAQADGLKSAVQSVTIALGAPQ